jgi:tetratricopeptide (TPR) repeat protein
MSSTSRLVCVAALSMSLALAAAPVAAQGAGALVQTGRSQYDNLQFEESIQTLSAAIIRRGNTPAQEVAIYELLGLSYLALSRDEEAEGAFRLVLARDPEHHLDAGTAPRVVEFYNRVSTRWVAEGRPGAPQTNTPARTERPVTIEHRSPAQQDHDTPLELTATLVDPDRRSAGLVLAWRAGSRGLFHRVDTQNRGGTYSATVPAGDVRPPAVEYYLEAVDQNHIAVAARGDAFAPLRVVVPETQSPSIFTRWWFWTGAGVVLAGAVVGTYFLVRGSDSAPTPATLTITLGER